MPSSGRGHRASASTSFQNDAGGVTSVLCGIPVPQSAARNESRWPVAMGRRPRPKTSCSPSSCLAVHRSDPSDSASSRNSSRPSHWLALYAKVHKTTRLAVVAVVVVAAAVAVAYEQVVTR